MKTVESPRPFARRGLRPADQLHYQPGLRAVRRIGDIVFGRWAELIAGRA